MKPFPRDLVLRWGPMWGDGCHGLRPWWRTQRWMIDRARRLVRPLGPDELPQIGFDIGEGWVRCDGRDAESTVEMESVDTHRPLPIPPPMPGQVWVTEDVEGGSRVAPWPPRATFASTSTSAFLVAGPTPWGRDVPWSAP